MSTALVPLSDIATMANAMGKAMIFGKNESQIMALMLIASAEGKHPAIAAQEYDIIDGKAAINSRSALARFQNAGGEIKYLQRDDRVCKMWFYHPKAGELEITWTWERAVKAGLTGKKNWTNYPAQMLSARCTAEGIRALYPSCLSGFYTTDEVMDFDTPFERTAPTTTPAGKVEPRNVTPEKTPETTPQAKKTEPATKPDATENTIDPEAWKKNFTSTIKTIGGIVKSEDHPEGWSKEDKEMVSLVGCLEEAKTTMSTDLLALATIRVDIFKDYRTTERRQEISDKILECGTDTGKLIQLKNELSGIAVEVFEDQ